eukprot:TRINITY_DN14375_c0_g2_i2.p1 TRINITY_DN14375_c0_g2~~TRINITY_DN14375_c0_g2_i2.p1  ORF type:complete len:151 (-),score=46.71 TRINITY_DN14375_c0_g2_i2:159-611(-)
MCIRDRDKAPANKRNELMKHLSKASKNMNLEENLEDINNELMKLKDAIANIDNNEEKRRKEGKVDIRKPQLKIEGKPEETKSVAQSQQRKESIPQTGAGVQFIVTNSQPNPSNQVSAPSLGAKDAPTGGDKKQSIAAIYGVSRDNKTKKK